MRSKQKRHRRESFEELLQIDRFPRDCFEGRNAKCCLVLLIDDATSKVTGKSFVPVEDANAYKSVLKEHPMKYINHRTIYSDRHCNFRMDQEVQGGRRYPPFEGF